jgi:hypothetical protein
VSDSGEKTHYPQMQDGTEIVTIFRPYQFQPGHKIHIDGGPGGGDWEVIEVGNTQNQTEVPRLSEGD